MPFQFSFVILLAAILMAGPTAAQEPRSAPVPASAYDLTLPQLADKVAEYAVPASAAVSYANGDLLLQVARFYLHTARAEKARELLPKIKKIGNRAFLLEIHAGMMAEDIAAGRDDAVMGRLNSLLAMYAAIELVEDIPDVPNSRVPRESFDSRSHNFCLLAAKAYAQHDNMTMFDKVSTLEPCREYKALLAQLRLHALLAHGHYSDAIADALAMDSAGEGYAPRGHSFEHVTIERGQQEPMNADRIYTFEDDFVACLPAVGDARPAAAAMAELTAASARITDAAKQEAEVVALSRLYLSSGDMAKGGELAKMIARAPIRARVMAQIYENYFLMGDAENTIRVAAEAGMFKDAPLEVGGFGRRNAAQWYNVAVPAVRVLAEKPGDLSYDISRRFENPRTRFTALSTVQQSLSRAGIKRVSGCDDDVNICIFREMEEIAAQEADEAARDYMYASIANDALRRHDLEGYRRLTSKVAKPDRMICRYDMCTNLLSGGSGVNSFAEKCALKIAGGDGGIAVLRALRPASQAARTLSRFADEGDAASEAAAREMLQCHVATGKYRAFIADPAPLGPARDTYLKAAAAAAAGNGNLDDAMQAAAGMSSTADRYDTVLTLGKKFFSQRNQFQDDGAAYLAAIDAQPTLRQDYTLWWRILNAVLQEQQGDFLEMLLDPDGSSGVAYEDRVAIGAKILADRPDIRAAFLKKPAYLVHNLCPLLADDIPADIPRAETMGRDRREALFQSCPAKLVRAGRYAQALHLTDALFADPEFNFRAQTDVLRHRLGRESLPYRQSSLVRKRKDDDAAREEEGGFAYLKQPKNTYRFTRGYESKYGCHISKKSP